MMIQRYEMGRETYGIRLESGGELSRDLIDKVVVGHALPILHDADNASLRPIFRSPPPPRYKGEHSTFV